jgi:hypothetical protein
VADWLAVNTHKATSLEGGEGAMKITKADQVIPYVSITKPA